MSKVNLICDEFRPLMKGTLRGFAIIRIPEWRLRLLDVSIHQHANGTRWASLPAKPQVDRNGQHIKRDGKPAYSPVIELIGGREVRDAFSAAVVSAVLAVHPRAFDQSERATT